MFVGLAGTAAASGFAVSIYEWHVSGIPFSLHLLTNQYDSLSVK